MTYPIINSGSKVLLHSRDLILDAIETTVPRSTNNTHSRAGIMENYRSEGYGLRVGVPLRVQVRSSSFSSIVSVKCLGNGRFKNVAPFPINSND